MIYVIIPKNSIMGRILSKKEFVPVCSSRHTLNLDYVPTHKKSSEKQHI